MICIHLFSSVCVYVCVCICGMRESNRGLTVCGVPYTTWEGTLDLFGSGLLCPCKLNFMCVCVYTSQYV